MKNKKIILSLFLLMAMASSSPYMANASNSSPCVKVPPGHLFAPGFLKRMLGIAPSVPACQTLPAGIAKKLGHFPPIGSDHVAPVISQVTAASITSSSATITWMTNENSSSQVMYGVSGTYGSSSTLNSNMLMSHSVTLSGLSVNTLYHFKVESKDAAGNISSSADLMFTTLVAGDVTAPVISNISASSISSSGATISWSTDENSSSQVMYGLSGTYGSNTTLDNTLVTSHSQVLTGLSSNTTYHYETKSVDSSGNAAMSLDYIFTTSI